MNVKSIVGAVAHITGGVTLYTSKGQEIFLPSDSWSTQLILEKVTPYLSTKTLHAKIGELTLENDFLSGALSKAGLLGGKK